MVNTRRSEKQKNCTQTTRQVFEILTVTSHAHCQALLQPAILTPIAVVLCDLAALAASALVAQLLADRAFEKTLATLATDGSIVTTCAKHFFLSLKIFFFKNLK
jgi:hypothetical protein